MSVRVLLAEDQAMVRGAIAAGMAVIGLDPHGDGAALRAAGAHPVRSLAELPALFRAAMRLAA